MLFLEPSNTGEGARVCSQLRDARSARARSTATRVTAGAGHFDSESSALWEAFGDAGTADKYTSAHQACIATPALHPTWAPEHGTESCSKSKAERRGQGRVTLSTEERGRCLGLGRIWPMKTLSKASQKPATPQQPSRLPRHAGISCFDAAGAQEVQRI